MSEKKRNLLKSRRSCGSKLLDKLINYRFIIAIILFMLILVFKIHGSSIGMWDTQYSEMINPSEKHLILGKNRPIRSDEWIVQTPYYLAQAMADEFYPLYNDNILSSPGQNMVIGYNSPVFDISIIGKPFNLGFLLLGKEYGLSWYWGLKLIAMFLLSFEMVMMLTGKNRKLSLLGALWITFSPSIQWWFMQHVGDIVVGFLGMVVAFYKYIEYHDSTKWKIAMSALFSVSAIGFILVIFPGLQVPFGYLTLVMMGVIFFTNIKKIKLDKRDILYVLSILAVIGFVCGYTLYVARNDLGLVMNTVYPGHRVSLGGDIEPFRFSEFIINVFMPFKDINIPFKYNNYLNNCEASSFINFFIGSSIVLFIAIKKKIKNLSMGIALFSVSVLQLLWCLVEMPVIFAKITFLSFVPGNRMLIAFGFTAMLFSIWTIGLLFKEKFISRKLGLVIATVNFVPYVLLILNSPYNDYVSKKNYLILFIVYFLINIGIFTRLKRVFAPILILVICLSGMTVNPIAKGVGAIYNKTISRAIANIYKEDPEAVWMTESGLEGSFLYANGVKAFNGVNFYPDMKKWGKTKGDNEEIYNRYAHVKADLTDKETSFEYVQLDLFKVNVSFEDLDDFGIEYIITKRNLEEEYIEYDDRIEEMYFSAVDDVYIYKIS